MSDAPVADSVRLALPAEAVRIAAVQRRSWAALTNARTSELLLAASDLDQMSSSWEQAITRPPDARCRVLVAVEGAPAAAIVGFGVTTPSPDGDADPRSDGAIAELCVDPAARRRGHGGRLLNACADTLRADGFGTARMWVPTTDDVLRRWLDAAGWAADGAHQEVGTEDDRHRIRLVRLHTNLSAD